MHATVLKIYRVPRSIVLQQELAAAGKRYGYDAGYVQATIYST